jgi:hypothetical protein
VCHCKADSESMTEVDGRKCVSQYMSVNHEELNEFIF